MNCFDMEASLAGGPVETRGLAIPVQATMPAPTLSGFSGESEFSAIFAGTRSSPSTLISIPHPTIKSIFYRDRSVSTFLCWAAA
jgi:hypothetical protein